VLRIPARSGESGDDVAAGVAPRRTYRAAIRQAGRGAEKMCATLTGETVTRRAYRISGRSAVSVTKKTRQRRSRSADRDRRCAGRRFPRGPRTPGRSICFRCSPLIRKNETSYNGERCRAKTRLAIMSAHSIASITPAVRRWSSGRIQQSYGTGPARAPRSTPTDRHGGPRRLDSRMTWRGGS